MKTKRIKGQFLFINTLIGMLLIAFICYNYIDNDSNDYYYVDDRVIALKEFKANTNNDVRSWLKVQGTNIDYPILYWPNISQTPNIDYDYLWINNPSSKLLVRTIIVGHNLQNVSSHPLVNNEYHKRFEQLMGFIYLDYAKDNKYIQYTIGDTNYLFKIFAVSFIKSDNFDKSYYNDEDISKYILNTIENSIYKYDIDVNKDDPILTLLTCTRFFGYEADVQFQIDARLVRKNEKIGNYATVPNDAYKIIERSLENEN